MAGEGLIEQVLGAAAGSARMAAAATEDVVGMRRHPDDWLDAWDPAYIRTTLPALRALSKVYFRAEVRGLSNIPAEGPLLLVGNHTGGTLIADTLVSGQSSYDHVGPAAARRQPLRRDVDRGHVRVRPGLLRPLRSVAALPPARPRPRVQAAGGAREPVALRHGPGLAGEHEGRPRPRCRAARLPRRRPRDLPAHMGVRPDRLRGPPRLRAARDRAQLPDRAGGRDRRPGDRALPGPGPRPRAPSPA